MKNDAYLHRRSSGAVRVVDAAGTPVANADVAFRLVNHEFLIGCGAFDSLPATAADADAAAHYHDPSAPGKAFYQDRMEKWLQVFNYGTLPFYWGGFEPKEGEPEIESRMNAAKFLREHNVRLKGHPLCWHTVCADWLLQYDNATILRKQIDRIHRDVTAFKGVIDMWDVINEVVIMPEFDRYDNAVTRLCKELGRIPLVKTVFDAAREANPDAALLINDFNLSEKYRQLIADCLDAGVSINAIGLQTHQHQGYMGRERLEEVLERYSGFGLPLHFTENTLVSGHLMPGHIVDLNDYQIPEWPTTPEGEERQKQEWRDMYEILFAHPLVEALTGWDFADGAWLGAPSGLIRKDGTVKPAYLEIKRLFQEEWTSNGTLHTDENGFATLEGFRGEYELTAAAGKAGCKLTKASGEEACTVVLQ